MTKYFILLFVSVPLLAESQLATINDPDGFTNIRKDKNAQSQIVGRLFNEDVFLFERGNDQIEWVDVFYHLFLDKLEPQKRDFFSNELHYTDNELHIEGFVHKSKLLPLKDMPTIRVKKTFTENKKLTLQNDTLIFTVQIKNFNPSEHKIDKNSYDNVYAIDGKWPNGTFGNIPKQETQNISLTINNKSIQVPKDCYCDLFELGLESVSLHTDNNGTLYIYMPDNSNGSGAYLLALVFKKDKFLKRYIDKF